MVLAVAGALGYYRTVAEKNQRYTAAWMTDVIGMGAERFRGASAILPMEAVVGYVSDLPVSIQRGQVWFYSARDALAPRLVVWPTDPQKEDWVLGNFSKPVNLEQIEKEYGLDLVQDLGSGVAVFRSE